MCMGLFLCRELDFVQNFCICSVDEAQDSGHANAMNNKIDANDSSKIRDECNWGNYPRGALYALQRKGNHLSQVKISLC